jgi:hypothetical protein
MTKKKRSDYTLLGDFAFTFMGKHYYAHVLVDADELLESQGKLAEASRFKRNKQDYGPFRVTVTAIGSDGKKEKRKRKQ